MPSTMKDEEWRNPRNQRSLELEKAWGDHEETEVVIRTINIIIGGFTRGGTMKFAHKKHFQGVLSLSSEKMKKISKPSSTSKIILRSRRDHPRTQ